MRALQQIAGEWAIRAFGRGTAMNHKERGLRVLEEAGEFAQAVGVTLPEAVAMATATWAKPEGEPEKELGQVGVTVLVAAHALGYNADQLIGDEVNRITRLPAEHLRDRCRAKANAGLSTFDAVTDARDIAARAQGGVDGWGTADPAEVRGHGERLVAESVEDAIVRSAQKREDLLKRAARAGESDMTPYALDLIRELRQELADVHYGMRLLGGRKVEGVPPDR